MELEDRRILEKTSRIREEAVDLLVTGGLPKEKEDREFLINMLNGLDKVAIARSRISADEKAAKTNGETSALIASILRKVNVGVSPQLNNDVVIPELPTELSEITMVPGEMHTGSMKLDIEDIVKW